LTMNSPLLRVYCFPFAGGSATVYSEWSRMLPPYVKVVPIDYPGHGRRFGQTPLSAIDEIVRVLAREILADLDMAFALYGHSMGALVAFELARELRRRGAPLPVKIYASATPPPVSPEHEGPGEDISALADDKMRERLVELGGTPQEILDNADLMELMLPIVRADWAACEDYVYRPETPLPCPITVLGGADDDTFDQSELTRWGEVTSKSFDVVTLPGGHFFLRTHTAALTRWLGEDIRKMLRIPL
jgi:medium-chain acyl-[acyl-carrier-protein] hydrolase